MTTSKNNTIVFFHTGRGGHFHNAGHVSFCGTKNISEVLSLNDSGNRNSFLNKENESEIYRLLKKRDLENLLELFETSRDNNDFSRFEKLTGLSLGEDVYTDCNGNQIITVAEVETGVGTLEWDGEYDTDTCMLLSDCGESELKLIADSNEWNKESLIQEFFSEIEGVVIDWKRVDEDRYTDLIEGYFSGFSFDAEEYYTEEIQDAD